MSMCPNSFIFPSGIQWFTLDEPGITDHATYITCSESSQSTKCDFTNENRRRNAEWASTTCIGKVDRVAFDIAIAIPACAATRDSLNGIESRKHAQLRVVVAGTQILQASGVGLLAGEAEVGQGGAGGINHRQRSAIGIVHGAGSEASILAGGEAHRVQAIVAEVAIVLHPACGFQPLADDIQPRPVPGVHTAGIGVGAQDLAQAAAQVQQIVCGHAIEHAPQPVAFTIVLEGAGVRTLGDGRQAARQVRIGPLWKSGMCNQARSSALTCRSHRGSNTQGR